MNNLVVSCVYSLISSLFKIHKCEAQFLLVSSWKKNSILPSDFWTGLKLYTLIPKQAIYAKLSWISQYCFSFPSQFVFLIIHVFLFTLFISLFPFLFCAFSSVNLSSSYIFTVLYFKSSILLPIFLFF